LLVHIGGPSSNQATSLESQMIHMIQELFGQTLRQNPPAPLPLELKMLFDSEAGFQKFEQDTEKYRRALLGAKRDPDARALLTLQHHTDALAKQTEDDNRRLDEILGRISAEEKLKPIGLSISFDNSPAYVSGSLADSSYYAFFVSVSNRSGVSLDRCILQLIITSSDGEEHSYPLCEPFSLLVDEHQAKPVVEYSPEKDGTKGEPHLVVPIFWRKETDKKWVRQPGGLVFHNHDGLVFEALSSGTRAVRLRLAANFENDQWKFDVLS
jgi:hypothetical protein